VTRPQPPAGEPGPWRGLANAKDRFRQLINRGLTGRVVGRQAAIVTAIAATPGRDRPAHRWNYTGAALASGRWMCVLDDGVTVYIVEVHPRTGEAWVVLSTPRTASGLPTPQHVRLICSAWATTWVYPGRLRSRPFECRPVDYLRPGDGDGEPISSA
jgi:hypothetical protein